MATVSFPLGAGQFMAGDLTTHEQVSNLLGNFTWTGKNLTVEEQDILEHWQTPYSGVYVSLAGFILFTVSMYITIGVYIIELDSVTVYFFDCKLNYPSS